MEAHLKDLLEKYKTGDCTAEEAQRLLSYLKSTEPALLAELIAEGLLDEATVDVTAKEVSSRVFTRITDRINPETSVSHPKRTIFLRYAAAAVIISLFVWGYQYWLSQGDNGQDIILSTAKGETERVLLPDGTIVWLNNASNIRYSEDFNQNGTRKISLSGEAFFEVVADPGRPFEVALPENLHITVLGTAFSVKTFAEDGGAKISLLHGIVNVSSEEGEILLRQPGEQVIYENSSASLVKNNIDTAYIGQWRNKMLAFDGSTMREALGALERRYNVLFRIEKADLLARFVTMRVKNESLDEILKSLSFSHDFKYHYVNDSTIVIR